MKILHIPFSNKLDIKGPEGQISGGGEKVIVNVHEMMYDRGYDSHVADTVTSHYEHPNVHRIIKPDTTSNQYVVDYAIGNGFDVIVNHGRRSIQKTLNESNLKSLFIDHSPITLLNKLYDEEGFTTTWRDAKDVGSKYIGVSEPQTCIRNESIRKMFGNDFEYDGWCKFQFVDTELNREVQDPEDYLIAVGRADPYKTLHIMKKFDIPYQVCTTPYHKNDSPTYKEYLTQHEGFFNQDCVHWDLPRETVLDKIMKARALVTTCRWESSGISSFEALCYGLPIILNEKGNTHASRHFADPGVDYICTVDEKEKISQFMKFDKEKRIDIANEVREYNSPDQFLKSFVPILESVKNPVRTNVFDFL